MEDLIQNEEGQEEKVLPNKWQEFQLSYIFQNCIESPNVQGNSCTQPPGFRANIELKPYQKVRI
jgi:hypothetical protein